LIGPELELPAKLTLVDALTEDHLRDGLTAKRFLILLVKARAGRTEVYVCHILSPTTSAGLGEAVIRRMVS